MKLLVTLNILGVSEALRRRTPLERKFVTGSDCLENNPHSIDNGDLHCDHKICTLKCNDGFDVYGGPKKIKCKQHSKPGPNWPQPIIDWNKDPGQCKTCNELPLSEDEPTHPFTISCSLTNKGGNKVHKCIFRCKNNKKINFGKLNPRRKAVTKCSCHKSDNDDRCHWKLGNQYLDKDASSNNFNTWSCPGWDATPVTTSLPSSTTGTTTPAPEPPASTTTQPAVTTTESNNVFRIPDNLTCPQQRNNFSPLDEGDRIVGGVEAKPNSWPWIVRLRIGAFLCGGTIVGENSVLTAAHCCRGFENHASQVKAIVSDHLTTDDDDGQVIFTADSVNIHPDYDHNTLTHDICMIRVPTMNLATLPNAAPACLPFDNVDHPDHGTRCWAAGWGKMADGKIATALQEVDVGIIDDVTCLETDNKDHLKDGMFCAGYLEGGKDGCQGDSGGPLVCAVNNKPVLYGVTSWGFGCAKPNSPGVWTKVNNYIEWINSFDN